MDPTETFKVMSDPARTLDERGQAAVDLLAWLAMGGGLPHPAISTPIRIWHARVVDDAKTVLAQVLDAAQADPVEGVLDQIRAGA